MKGMDVRERKFFQDKIEYTNQLKKCKWWQFAKKVELKNKISEAHRLMEFWS